MFCPDANETKVGYEKYTPTSRKRDDLVSEFLKRLQSEPKDIGLRKALPDDVKVTTYDGRAYLQAIDEKYDVIIDRKSTRLNSSHT